MKKRSSDMYDAIVAKLGFEPKDYVPIYKGYESDNFESPFSVLTVEELDFLSENNCFTDTAQNTQLHE